MNAADTNNTTGAHTEGGRVRPEWVTGRSLRHLQETTARWAVRAEAQDITARLLTLTDTSDTGDATGDASGSDAARSVAEAVAGQLVRAVSAQDRAEWVASGAPLCCGSCGGDLPLDRPQEWDVCHTGLPTHTHTHAAGDRDGTGDGDRDGTGASDGAGDGAGDGDGEAVEAVEGGSGGGDRSGWGFAEHTRCHREDPARERQFRAWRVAEAEEAAWEVERMLAGPAGPGGQAAREEFVSSGAPMSCSTCGVGIDDGLDPWRTCTDQTTGVVHAEHEECHAEPGFETEQRTITRHLDEADAYHQTGHHPYPLLPGLTTTTTSSHHPDHTAAATDTGAAGWDPWAEHAWTPPDSGPAGHDTGT